MIRIPKLFLVLLMFTGSHQMMAQNIKNQKTKKTTISIITEEDGKKIKIDTTFENASQADINVFLKKQGVIKSTPPVPPVPPLPPAPPAAPDAPVAPLPPLPPNPALDVDDTQSFNFHFEMPEIDESLKMTSDDEMAEAKEAMKNAKIKMRFSMEETNRSMEEMEKIIQEKVHKQVKKEMKQFKFDNDIDEDNDHKQIEKHIIIKKKTSDSNEENIDTNSADAFTNDHPQIITTTVTSFSDEGGDPIILTEDFKGNRSCYTTKYRYIRDTNIKQGKFKRFMKRVTDKILD